MVDSWFNLLNTFSVTNHTHSIRLHLNQKQSFYTFLLFLSPAASQNSEMLYKFIQRDNTMYQNQFIRGPGSFSVLFMFPNVVNQNNMVVICMMLSAIRLLPHTGSLLILSNNKSISNTHTPTFIHYISVGVRPTINCEFTESHSLHAY